MRKLILLTILIMVAAAGGMIPCYGQTGYSPQPCDPITLTCPQFDFYAKSLVERNALVIDTMLLNQQNNALALMFAAKSTQLNNQIQINGETNKMVEKYRDGFENAVGIINNQTAKIRRKNTGLIILTTISVVAVGLVVIK
jgi:hypothetical protein